MADRLSGEHGDGQSRAELLDIMYGDELLQCFREFKAIWDPGNRLNPGKAIEPFPINSNLRLGLTYRPQELETRFRFPDDHGSFAHATTRCVGVGKCRRRAGRRRSDVPVLSRHRRGEAFDRAGARTCCTK